MRYTGDVPLSDIRIIRYTGDAPLSDIRVIRHNGDAPLSDIRVIRHTGDAAEVLVPCDAVVDLACSVLPPGDSCD